MDLKHYFPLSVGVFLLLVLTTRYLGVPLLPFAIILLAGETLLGFQVEDHKVPRLLGKLFGAFKSSSHHHA